MAAIPGFTTASAAASPGAETRVGAFNAFGEVLVGPPQHITVGQRLGEVAPRPGFVVATGVAANTAARACSFAGATTVLMADGSRKPIEDVKVGDEVIATDPETGEQVAKTVEHLPTGQALDKAEQFLGGRLHGELGHTPPSEFEESHWGPDQTQRLS